LLERFIAQRKIVAEAQKRSSGIIVRIARHVAADEQEEYIVSVTCDPETVIGVVDLFSF
jgi:hypothetical protein